MTAAALRAARAASLPCPRPSIAATSAPSGRRLTTARSPLVASPRRHLVATLHSTGSDGSRSRTPPALLPQARELVAIPPLSHRHGRPGVGVRRDLEVVHQATGSSQTEAQAAAAAVLVAERHLDVADSRSLIAGDYHEPVAVGVLERPEHDFATADVDDDVACDLRYGGGDQGGIGSREAEPLGHGSSRCTRGNEVRVGVDRHADLILNPLRPSASGDRVTLLPHPNRARRGAAPGSSGTAPSRSPRPAGCRR